MLVLSRKPHESIIIGNDIRVVVIGLEADHVKLGIEAPRDVPVHRYEIYEEINKGNRSVETSVGKASAKDDTSRDADGN
jgi:carbon storage regulator